MLLSRRYPTSIGEVASATPSAVSRTPSNLPRTFTPNSSAAISQISFRVQNAIRGTRRGQVVEIREWGGLWTTGERYTAGENVLLFLYPNSKLGLTSPVGGRAGRLRIDKMGRVEIEKENTAFADMDHRSKVPVRKFAAAIRRAANE